MSIRRVIINNGEQRWEVRVHENGRGSKRITKRFERKSDAEFFLENFKKEIRERANNPFDGSSLKDRIFKGEAEHWLRDGENRFSASHLVRARGILKNVLPSMGDLTLDRFTPDFLAKYQQKEKAKQKANSTVNRETECILAILNFSAKQRRIPFNPAIGFKKFRKDQKEMTFWEKDDAISFMTKMDEMYPRGSEKRWVYVVYILALNTAMRAGEIWGLKVSDIVADENAIWVRRQFNRVTLDFGPTKGKKPRYVPANDVLLDELKDLIKKRKLRADDTIFRTETGKPVCHDNFTDRQFAKDLRSWGGKALRFHDLRHTATTLLIAGGVDLKTVKEICGHADISTTMNYVHLLPGSIGRVAQMFSIQPEKPNGKAPNAIAGKAVVNGQQVTDSSTQDAKAISTTQGRVAIAAEVIKPKLQLVK